VHYERCFDEMFSEQKKEKESTTKFAKFPISYCSKEGTYIFRIYPENYNGKPRMRRVIWSNTLHKFRKVLAVKGDNRISDLLKEYEDCNNQKTMLWRHKAKQEAIILAYLISAPKDKNIREDNSASLLVLDNTQMNALDGFLSSLEEEGVSLRNFLHPNKPSNAIKMVVKKDGKKFLVNFSATTNNEYILPPLNEALPQGIEFNGLDKLHVPTDAFLTDELFNEFKTHIEKECLEVRKFKENNVYNPKDQEQERGYDVNKDEKDLHEVGKAALKK
jgi:hypothetical protein